MDIFEKATRVKLRWLTAKGSLSVEDLWDLKLTDLDLLARAANRILKEETEESFISKKTTNNSELELSLDVLKRIIEVKLKEQEDKKVKAQRAEELATLKALLADKRQDELKSLSSEEIQKRIEELKS